MLTQFQNVSDFAAFILKEKDRQFVEDLVMIPQITITITESLNRFVKLLSIYQYINMQSGVKLFDLRDDLNKETFLDTNRNKWLGEGPDLQVHVGFQIGNTPLMFFFFDGFHLIDRTAKVVDPGNRTRERSLPDYGKVAS